MWLLTPGSRRKKQIRPGASTCSTAKPVPAAAIGQELKRIDFVTTCEDRFAPKVKPEVTEEQRDEIFQRMTLTAEGGVWQDELAVAAWLYRLGHDGLAARALAVARQEKGDPSERLRRELAWSAYAGTGSCLYGPSG